MPTPEPPLYEGHELAGIFPLLDGQPFQELVEDIRSHGLREPIVILDDQILDGRNRYRACLQAGVEPRFEVFEGDDPVPYVLSRNLHRRHLSEAQRAAVSARLANLDAGCNQHVSGRANLPDHMPAVTIARAAELLNVSERSVKTARAVQRDAVPEVVAKVDAGKLSLAAASAVSKLPAAQQRDIASKDDEELKAKLRELSEAAKKHRAKMAALPSKEEALVISEETGNMVRANDGNYHVFVPDAERAAYEIWSSIKPEVEAIAETSYTPQQFADSADGFWLPKFPTVLGQAIAFLTEAKQLMEARHEATQIAAE